MSPKLFAVYFCIQLLMMAFNIFFPKRQVAKVLIQNLYLDSDYVLLNEIIQGVPFALVLTWDLNPTNTSSIWTLIWFHDSSIRSTITFSTKGLSSIVPCCDPQSPSLFWLWTSPSSSFIYFICSLVTAEALFHHNRSSSALSLAFHKSNFCATFIIFPPQHLHPERTVLTQQYPAFKQVKQHAHDYRFILCMHQTGVAPSLEKERHFSQFCNNLTSLFQHQLHTIPCFQFGFQPHQTAIGLNSEYWVSAMGSAASCRWVPYSWIRTICSSFPLKHTPFRVPLPPPTFLRYCSSFKWLHIRHLLWTPLCKPRISFIAAPKTPPQR